MNTVTISGAQRKRLRRLLLLLAALGAGGLLYAAFVSATGLAVPCMFRLITGIECPGCGVSRMCLALLRLDFSAAWEANPAIMALLPLGAAVFADLSVRYVKDGSRRPDRFSNAAMAFMIAVLILFGVWRALKGIGGAAG